MRARGDERGAILLMALVILSIVALLAASFLASSSLQLSVGIRERDRGRARVLARSGLERARWELTADGSWPGTPSEVLVAGDAGYRVGVVSGSNGAVTITAVGRHEARAVTLVAEGWIRPYHGTMTISTEGAALESSGDNPGNFLDIEGAVHLDDPGANGVVHPQNVSISGDILDEGTHAITLYKHGGAYIPNRPDRPLPEVDWDALYAAHPVTYGIGDAIPDPLTGTGVVVIEVADSVTIPHINFSGTVVVSCTAVGRSLILGANNDDVVNIDAGTGLALCAPGMTIVTEASAKVNLTVVGTICCGGTNLIGTVGQRGTTRVTGRILSTGAVRIIPTGDVELTRGQPALSWPTWFGGDSMRVLIERVTER